jgi:tripartite-type tricarboxylate transporter receptor subunit TctC
LGKLLWRDEPKSRRIDGTQNENAAHGRRRMHLIRMIAAAVLGLSGIVVAQPSTAQAWPERPIRWIVPYPPGGGTDIAARLIGDKLSQNLGQPVIVDNRPGGNTIIGTSAMVQAAPDGYTVGLVTDAFSANIALGRKMPYNSLHDLVPVVQILEVPFVLIVNPDLVPMRTLPELIKHAKANPKWLTLASLGPGSPHQTALEWFAHMAGINALIVPYRGGGPAMQDLLAGQVKGMMFGSSSALEMIRTGKVRAIAVTSQTRLESLPDVPTMQEQGYPEYEFASWFGVVAPAKTPQTIIDRLNHEINVTLRSPDVRDKLISTGSIVTGGSAAQFNAKIRGNVDRYRKIFALTGATPK